MQHLRRIITYIRLNHHLIRSNSIGYFTRLRYIFFFLVLTYLIITMIHQVFQILRPTVRPSIVNRDTNTNRNSTNYTNTKMKEWSSAMVYFIESGVLKVKNKIELISKTPLLDMSNQEKLLFVRYINTQSSSDTIDQLFVMQTIINRCLFDKISFNTYYNNRKYNQSESIAIMRHILLKIDLPYYIPPRKIKAIANKIHYEYDHYKLMIDRLNRILYHKLPIQQTIPANIMYFESFKRPPNKRPHLLSRLYGKVKHRFYYKLT